MRSSLQRHLALLAALVAALALTACGNKTSTITVGETEGTYVDVGPMKYQIQVSRQLNPAAIPEDATFVSDIQGGGSQLAADEAWFAVFIRIENPTKQAHSPATEYLIEDTEGNEYRPVQLGALNPFHFHTQPVAAGSAEPDPDSVASQTSINGMLLLYRVKRTSLDNRPLEMVIRSARDSAEARITLDV